MPYRFRFFVDTLPLRYLLAAGISATLYLVIMLIVGLSGPNAHVRWEQYAFTCDDTPNYKWNASACEGVNMGDPGAIDHLWIPPLFTESGLAPINYQFSLIAWPYNANYATTTGTYRGVINVTVILYGTNSENYTYTPLQNSAEWSVVINHTSTQTLLCPKKHPDCAGFILFLQRGIEFSHYFAVIQFTQTKIDIVKIENVLWETTAEDADFNQMRIGFRMTYFCFAVLLLALWIIPLRKLARSQWPFEQRAGMLLLVALVFFNNPFFPLQFSHRTWVLPFLDTVFQIGFECLLLTFWFNALDHIRATELKEKISWTIFIKYALILLYGLLSVILFSWIDARIAFSPNLGSESLSGAVILFYLTSCLFGGIILWLVVLAVITVPSAYSKPYLEVRFMYMSFPACIVCMSLLIGTFSGNTGPYSRSSIAFLYFFGLYNVYMFLLVFGFFPNVTPLSEGFHAICDAADAEELPIHDSLTPETAAVMFNQRVDIQ